MQVSLICHLATLLYSPFKSSQITACMCNCSVLLYLANMEKTVSNWLQLNRNLISVLVHLIYWSWQCSKILGQRLISVYLLTSHIKCNSVLYLLDSAFIYCGKLILFSMCITYFWQNKNWKDNYHILVI